MKTKTPFLFLPVLALTLLACPFTGRAQAPGSLDTTFNPGTGANFAVNALAVQDGKVIAGGEFTEFNDTPQSYLVRLNADGSVDTGFNIGAGANAGVDALAVKVNGQIMVGGAFTFFGGVAQSHLARINKDGTLDTAFKTGTGANDTVSAIVAQDDGKVVIAGAFTKFNSTACNGLVRLNTDGSVDTAYTPPDDLSFNGAALLLQPDGKIVTVDPFVRLNTDGTLDDSFDISLPATTSFNCLGLQSSGKIVWGGQEQITASGETAGKVGRVDTNGATDASFDGSSVGKDLQYIEDLAVQTNDAVIVAESDFTGSSSTHRVTRLTADGAPDNAFLSNAGSNANDTVTTVTLQDNGKIVIGGAFTSFNGVGRHSIARLNGDSGPGELQFKTVTFRVVESQSSVRLDVRRVGGGKGAVSVTYVTKDGTAQAGTDYTSTSGTLNWADGDNAVKTIVVPILNPFVTDGGTRTFQVGLSLPTGGATVGPLSAANVQILDNDSPKPVITSPATATATAGQPFNYQIVASNKPTSYGVAGLPPGLKVNAQTGLITGTPTTDGSKSLLLKATNNGGTGTLTLTLNIASGAPVITSPLTATGTQDTPFTYQITASNGPTYFALANSLGLSVDHATGKVTGTPSAAPGTYALTIKASNARGIGQATLSVTIKAAAPVITSAGTANGKVGQAFTYQIVASHDPTNYAVANQAPGLQLNNKTGKITGSPTKAGTFVLTLKAANSGGLGQKTLTLTVTR